MKQKMRKLLCRHGSNETIVSMTGSNRCYGGTDRIGKTAYDNHFYGMASVTNCAVYCCFLFLFYKLVRRMMYQPIGRYGQRSQSGMQTLHSTNSNPT